MLGSGNTPIPSVATLDRPEPLHKTLAQDKVGDDCLPCRVIGASAFIGLGAYSYFSGHSQLKQQEAEIIKSAKLLGMKSRRAGITGIALSLLGVGVYRLVN
jgi:hypothetical protein